MVGLDGEWNSLGSRSPGEAGFLSALPTCVVGLLEPRRPKIIDWLITSIDP